MNALKADVETTEILSLLRCVLTGIGNAKSVFSLAISQSRIFTYTYPVTNFPLSDFLASLDDNT